jgi:hypothetical protein
MPDNNKDESKMKWKHIVPAAEAIVAAGLIYQQVSTHLKDSGTVEKIKGIFAKDEETKIVGAAPVDKAQPMFYEQRDTVINRFMSQLDAMEVEMSVRERNLLKSSMESILEPYTLHTYSEVSKAS